MTGAKARLWVAAGWVSFGLGVIGALLPVMPTVPFMIVAALCFSRGSKRWHQWLTGHPRYGQPIRDWESHGVIRNQAKVISSVLIMGSMLSSIFIVQLPFQILAFLGLIFALVLIFIWTRPSQPPQA